MKEGGHRIPKDVIRRRYTSGLRNFFNIYIQNVNFWVFVNNSDDEFEIIAKGSPTFEIVEKQEIWTQLRKKYDGN